jgi:hypothetical protein
MVSPPNCVVLEGDELQALAHTRVIAAQLKSHGDKLIRMMNLSLIRHARYTYTLHART